MIDPVFAHPGHWAVQLAYLTPLGVLVVALVVGKVRERREARELVEPADVGDRPAD